MIRKYYKRDLEAILEIWEGSSAIAHPFLSNDFIKQERKNIQDIYIPNTQTWVYEKQNSILGFISMINNEVGAIFVRPQYQQQGIGSQLMDFVYEIYRELEVEVFKKNIIGQAFYFKYGFETIGEYLHEGSKEIMLRMKYKSHL